MATIKTRSGKGSPLTNAEVDANFNNLNTDKLEKTASFGGDVTGTYSNLQVKNDSHTHDGRYYTETEADSRFVNTDGDTMTGRLILPDAGYSIGNEYHTWKRSYVINNTSPANLLYHDGNALPSGGAYRFHAHIAGTGTDQSATAVFWNQNGTWKVNVTYQSDTRSNHPEFIIGGSPEAPQIHIDHTSNYTVEVLGERLELTEGTGTDNLAGFGADAFLGSVGGVLRYNNAGSANNYAQGNVVFHDGYHPNADKWTTARTLNLTGDVTGSVSWDGSGDASLSTTVANDSHNHDHSDGDFTVNGALYVAPTATSSNIYMGDTDHGQRRIHNNSNQIGFLDSANGWGCYADDAGNWYSTDSVRAPIFYDSNNTAYYGDFASTSRVNVVRFNQLYSTEHSYEKIDLTNGNAHCLGSESYYNTYGPFSGGWNGGTIGHKFYSHNGSEIARIGTGGSSVNKDSSFYGNVEINKTVPVLILKDSDSTSTGQTGWVSFKDKDNAEKGYVGFGSGSTTDMYLRNALGRINLNASYTYAAGSMRSPIFYDSANTAFYWDPNNSNAHKFQTASGYVHIGPMNTSHCHINTDRSNFYFNTEIRVDTGKIGSYNEDLQLHRAQNDSHKITIGAGTTTVSQNTVVQGTVQHNGLVMTSGTNVDQLYTYEPSLTVGTDWTDVGISGSTLPTGTYIVQVHVYNSDVGGSQYSEHYSGTMSWYGAGTNDTSWDEIPLHSAGHHDGDQAIYLRTLRQNSGVMKLQIAGDGTTTGPDVYTFKFRRMI